MWPVINGFQVKEAKSWDVLLTAVAASVGPTICRISESVAQPKRSARVNDHIMLEWPAITRS